MERKRLATKLIMSREERREVLWAVHEMYTLDDIYKYIQEGSWTEEMFKSFVNTIARRK